VLQARLLKKVELKESKRFDDMDKLAKETIDHGIQIISRLIFRARGVFVAKPPHWKEDRRKL